MSSWLRTRADAYLSATSEQRDSAHYELLWAVVAAPADELGAFAARLWDDPYDALPVPILAACWRLAGLESDDPEVIRHAIGGVSAHCTPHEEDGAVAGLRARLAALDGSG